jgi:alkanesulfonate monooxygenase SsuD/methylene tetrahydromethanopterin reductase-like flavin-dependent oxidoreductase (luciferase family)
VVVAETDAEAARLLTSQQQQFIALYRGMAGQLPPPVDDLETLASPQEIASVNHALREGITGSRLTVRRGIERFLERTGVDEIIATAHIFDHAARLRSYEFLAEIRDEMSAKPAVPGFSVRR